MSSECRIRPEALDAYFHGMLNDAQHREMSAHLLTCPACNRTLSALEAETYIIGKGLRNVEIPAMSMSAAELVARYAGTRAPDATTVELPVEQSEYDEAPKKHAVALMDAAKQAKPPRLKLVRWIAASAADSMGRRNALATAAAIALVCGASVWFAVSMSRRLDTMNAAQLTQAKSIDLLNKQQEEKDRNDSERHSRNEGALADLRDKVIGQMQKQIAQAMTLLQEQDKDRTTIADLQRQLVVLKTTIEKQEVDATRIKAIENELEQRKAIVAGKEARLHELLDQIRDLNQQQEVAEVDPAALNLASNPDDAVTWEEIKGGQALGTLRTKSGIVGWAVSLNQIHAGEDGADNGLDAAHLALTALGDSPRYNAPAVKDNKVFVGNGWHENGLVAIDASTGQLKWTYATRDGGVGSPTLSDDGRFVYFTTGSGSVYSVTTNGKKHWVRNFGDAILTQPAVNGNLIYVIHSTRNSPPGFGDKKFPFSITCLNELQGNVSWTKGLSADALTSPVIDGNKVYVATRDGQLSIFDAKGINSSTYAANATSAPAVSGNSMYFSTWDTSDAGFEESICRLGSSDIGKVSERLAGPFAATYFMPRSLTPSDLRYTDPKLGEKRDAQSERPALPQLRHGWSYLGARPTIIEQTAYAAVGDHLVSVDLRSGKPNWSKKIVGQSDNAVAPGQGQPSLTPPSFAGGRLYLGSIWGDMLCVDAKSGETVWRYRLPDAVTSQVVLDQGMAYATTSKGQLICINTKDASATGWNMWGGSPSHNGPAASPSASGAKFNTH